MQSVYGNFGCKWPYCKMIEDESVLVMGMGEWVSSTAGDLTEMQPNALSCPFTDSFCLVPTLLNFRTRFDHGWENSR